MLLPLGSMDEWDTKVKNRQKVLQVFQNIVTNRGFKGINTPVVEYAATYTHSSVGIKLEDMMKWFNTQGEIEVLRPDWTIAIARALVSQKSPYKKWAYQGPIYQLQQPGLEKMQAGVEVIDSPELLGEMECLLLAVTLIKDLKVGPVLIELGHTGIFDDFVQDLPLNNVHMEKLKQAMYAKRKDEVYSLVLEHSSAEKAREFASLVDTYGSYELLDHYKKVWLAHPRRLLVIEHLQKVADILKACGVEDVIIDLGQVKQMPYYSGTIFRGFLKMDGTTCFSGGRYDQLYHHFGKKMSGVGLAFDVDALAEKMIEPSKQEIICVIATEETLSFAEQLRSQFQDAVLDIRFSVDDQAQYDKILYLIRDDETIKVVD